MSQGGVMGGQGISQQVPYSGMGQTLGSAESGYVESGTQRVFTEVPQSSSIGTKIEQQIHQMGRAGTTVPPTVGSL
jgi:hypothetical protein